MDTLSTPVNPKDGEGDQYLWKANREVPASLLARLSEAADGIRNGKPIYFVAQLVPDPESGHDVMGYFNSVKEAYEHPPAKALLKTGKYMIFGPYRTDDDKGYKQKDVIKVVIYRKKGKPVELDGAKFDCIFWSLSAMDKFVIPYYTSIGDLKKAEKVRKDFIKEASIAGIHIPGSDIVNEAPAQQIGAGPSTTAGLRLDEIRDRVGLYQMIEEKGQGFEPIFLPL